MTENKGKTITPKEVKGIKTIVININNSQNSNFQKSKKAKSILNNFYEYNNSNKNSNKKDFFKSYYIKKYSKKLIDKDKINNNIKDRSYNKTDSFNQI
jgi:hypothetical protein